MHSFSFTISLRIRNGDFEPEAMTQALSLTPRCSWRKGDEILARGNTKPVGVRETSYWTHNFQAESTENFETFLNQVLASLRPQEKVFREFKQAGYTVELLIGLFGSKTFGYSISSANAADLMKLELNLEFDISPENQP